ncbi:retroviral-like aspartic protease family protein [Candidatus Bathyarchaeota archaeon]|nr:retroviral-like aspartic protease family protein [Candidatus Bathyarchaeota archaeon]
MKYSFNYNPPAPSLKVRLTNPTSTHSIELEAKLDTGADITVLPQHAISELRLIPAGRLSVTSFDGREERKYTYFVNLQFNSFKFPMIEAISAKRRDALLGRDVLNLIKIILDGKTLSFELLDP